MAILFLEAGSDATFGTEFYTIGAGTVTSDSGQARTGPRSINCAGSNGNPAEVRALGGSLSQTGGRFSFGLRFSAFPSARILIVLPEFSGVTALRFGLFIDNAGQLSLAPDLVTFTTGSTLSINTWYRVTVTWNITSGAEYTLKTFLGGIADITIVNGATLNGGSSNVGMRFGWVGDPGLTATLYLDDVYIDDDSSNTDPGNISVTAKRPFSNGGANNFATQIGAGGSGYGSGHSPQVNERPLSQTNGWEDTSAVGDQENYTLESASTGDVDVSSATLVGRCAWLWAKIDTASVLSKIMDNGSESAITLTTSPALYTLLTTSASYPSNAAGIGIRSSTTPNTFLYECGTLIAYIPLTGPTVAQMTPAWEQLTDGGGLFAKRYV